MGKEKSKDGDNDARIECKEPNELKALCDLCSVQVLDVIEQLGEMGKVVTYLQVKNKWDHLRKQWRVYNECFHNETGLGIDAATRRLHATNKWWTRKIAACPKAKTFNSKAMPNRDSMDIRFRGTIAMGKNAFYTSGQIPKESTEGPSLSKAELAVNKGKGLASSVHLFKPICKKPRKKRLVVQEMSGSLKSISDFIALLQLLT
ncbi:hypothetical protein SO802_009717 [Lithocarpus litseifolius]|uniref:Myb/SANT-like domain-containing protein n=1 Tax=Lithocarpus litseifolius TaxID=425828 RepID=A0AAW2DGA9_9ROSI